MTSRSAWILLLALGLLLPALSAAAEETEATPPADVEQVLEAQQQTIEQLEKRIEELEAHAGTSAAPPEEGPALPTSEPGEAPSPFEQAEAEAEVRYGRQSQIRYRGNLNDQQLPASRPGDLMLDPMLRGFMPIPRTVFLIRFNAQPRVDLNATSASAGSDFRFVPALFPMPGTLPAPGVPGYSPDWRVSANANGTQLRLDLRAPTAPGSFRFYYQNDFFGSDQSQMQYRLQHVYGEIYGVQLGFTFGLFEDPDAWPDTVDYEAPNSVIFARRAVFHYQRALGEDWQLIVGVENPGIAIDTTGDPNATTRARMPDTGFNVRWEPGALGHVQLSSIFRAFGTDSVTTGSQDVFGWGVNLSGALNPSENDTLIFWFNVGEGIGGMGNDTSFVNSDAAFDAFGRLEALFYWSALGAVTHHWSPRWRSTATYGYVDLENTALQLPTAYQSSHYASLNLVYRVFKRMNLGIEGLWGRKVVRSGARTDVARIQMSVTYRFFD